MSLDVVLSDVWGDLLKPSTRAFWKDAIRQGFVVALLGGPPCETWSQARERQVEKNAPRVLRTAAIPWGKESLSLREMRQLCVGNSLMGFQLQAVVELYCVGGVAFTEHPAKKIPIRYLLGALRICSCLATFPALSSLISRKVCGVQSPENPPPSLL